MSCNYSILLIDLDDFKTINDVFGYEFGNKVLNESRQNFIKYL